MRLACQRCVSRRSGGEGREEGDGGAREAERASCSRSLRGVLRARRESFLPPLLRLLLLLLRGRRRGGGRGGGAASSSSPAIVFPLFAFAFFAFIFLFFFFFLPSSPSSDRRRFPIFFVFAAAGL